MHVIDTETMNEFDQMYNVPKNGDIITLKGVKYLVTDVDGKNVYCHKFIP